MTVLTPGSRFEDDEKLLSLIKTGNRTILEETYKDFRSKFKSFLMKQFSCSPEEALEVYPEAFSIMYFKIKEEKLTAPLRAKLQTYVNSVGRNLFLKKLNDTYNSQTDHPEEFPDQEIDADISLAHDRNYQAQVLQKALNQIGDKCKEVLHLFFYQDYSVEAVMNQMDFPSEGAVRKRKHDCLKKLGSVIRRVGGQGSPTILFR